VHSKGAPGVPLQSSWLHGIRESVSPLTKASVASKSRANLQSILNSLGPKNFGNKCQTSREKTASKKVNAKKLKNIDFLKLFMLPARY
jgi:hypothetical protein